MHRFGSLITAVTVALMITGSAAAAPESHANCTASFATLGRGSDQHISYLAQHDHPGEPDAVGRVARICHSGPSG